MMKCFWYVPKNISPGGFLSSYAESIGFAWSPISSSVEPDQYSGG